MKFLRFKIFRSPVWEYITAVVAIAIAAWLRMAIDRMVDDELPFVTVICAILVTATYAGIGPCVLAVGLGWAAGTYSFISPRGSFIVDAPDYTVRMIFLFMDGAIIIVVIQMLRSAQRRAKASAERVMKQNEDLEREKRLLRQLFDKQEQRWKLIVYEIHDGIVQYATGALMHVETYAHSLKNKPAPDEIASVTLLLRKAVDEGRRLINGIRPPTLDTDGIVPAIEQLIDEQIGDKPHVEFVKGRSFERLSPSIESTIYRIVQETLTNARKHSKSEKIEVKLDHNGDRIHLEVRDWGIGFEPARVPGDRFGLQGITRRVNLLGGEVTVESTLGTGTCISIDLPHAYITA